MMILGSMCLKDVTNCRLERQLDLVVGDVYDHLMSMRVFNYFCLSSTNYEENGYDQ